jgi:hypothetical protein
MIIHQADTNVSGAGRWDKGTGRYIPMNGGSRSRLPMYDSDPKIPRYFGFVGVDERLSESISSVHALYKHMGGAPKIEAGAAGTLASRIQSVMEEQRKAEALAAEAAKHGGAAPAAAPEHE